MKWLFYSEKGDSLVAVNVECVTEQKSDHQQNNLYIKDLFMWHTNVLNFIVAIQCVVQKLNR